MLLQIQLPNHEEALAFNRKRWSEVLEDAELAANPNRIETNAWGQIIMTPPPGGPHSCKQSEIHYQLRRLIVGKPLVECPISTADGVRAVDVAWYSESRYAKVRGQWAFEIAPEICVEILSPSNSELEMKVKRQLYFAAGAMECWICDLDGKMSYYHVDQPDTALTQSKLCPDFPSTITD